jgi:hypothetical protein
VPSESERESLVVWFRSASSIVFPHATHGSAGSYRRGRPRAHGWPSRVTGARRQAWIAARHVSCTAPRYRTNLCMVPGRRRTASHSGWEYGRSQEDTVGIHEACHVRSTRGLFHRVFTYGRGWPCARVVLPCAREGHWNRPHVPMQSSRAV